MNLTKNELKTMWVEILKEEKKKNPHLTGVVRQDKRKIKQ